MGCQPTTMAFAKYQTYGFHIAIPTHQENGREDIGRYRGDVGAKNLWGVNMIRSTEKTQPHTATDFWLELLSGVNVSPSVRAVSGRSWYTQVAFSTATRKKVYLTAEDNTNNANGYIVSGRWLPRGAKGL